MALAEELETLPEYRRSGDVTAFVEGWALHSEFLGDEMGLYRTPYERLGGLSMEMWRACRLVIDAGFHWLDWTRDRAVACLRDNSALAPDQIEHEVDRYIGWPGQALAYKSAVTKFAPRAPKQNRMTAWAEAQACKGCESSRGNLTNW